MGSACAAETTARGCNALSWCTYYKDRAVEALRQLVPQLDPAWIQATDNPFDSAGPTIAFMVLLPDQMSSSQFITSLRQCLQNACAYRSECPLAHAQTQSLTVTGEAKCSNANVMPTVSMQGTLPLNDVNLASDASVRAATRVTPLVTQAENGAALTLPSMLCLVLAAAAASFR